MIKPQNGFILFMTFAMLSICTVMVSMFFIKGMEHKRFSSALLAQEEMINFAVSTVSIGQSALAISVKELKPEKEDDTSEPAPSLAQLVLEKIMPILNKTQKLYFQEIESNFPAEISLSFFCESGKINLNSLYDLVQNKFYDEGVAEKDKKVFATWLFGKIAKITEKPSLLQPFIEHVKQRKLPFNDVTELLSIKEFAACFLDTVFYSPDLNTEIKDEKVKKIFLTDIFTVASETQNMQPRLLSTSVCALLDIELKNNKQEIKGKKVDLSSFKPDNDWKKDWDSQLKPLYGISYEQIPESVRSMFAPSFNVTVFSMLATIKNEGISATIFAILKQKRLPDSSVAYDVIKVYQV